VPVADRSDYPAFVAGCWTRLLRTAYLLVQDWAAAEDLTQAALVKAWLAWPRLDDDPEAYVRKIIVTTHVSWWRRRWRHRETTTGQPPERPDTASETVHRHLSPRPQHRRQRGLRRHHRQPAPGELPGGRFAGDAGVL
jgi:DNA-directed RNA polymerase specialized sigma24 family protein